MFASRQDTPLTSAFLEGMAAKREGLPVTGNPYRVPEAPPCGPGRRSISAEILTRLHEAWENGWRFGGPHGAAPSDQVIIV